MKKILPLLLLLSACTQYEIPEPPAIPPACLTESGDGYLNFVSDYYGKNETYNLNACNTSITYKTHYVNTNLFKGTLQISNDTIALGFNFRKRLIVDDTMYVTDDSMYFVPNIADVDMYRYSSTGTQPGSYIIATSITDSTMSGHFSFNVSRRRTFNTGTNMDSLDNSVVKGSFNNFKIQWKSL